MSTAAIVAPTDAQIDYLRELCRAAGFPFPAVPEPHPKSKQLARGERRYRRKVASPKQWQAIIAAKGSTCRLADHFLALHHPIEYHHLISRAQGGDDLADNVVPLCRVCHRYITHALPLARQRLSSELTDGEYAYVIGKLGEGAMTRLFGV